MNWEHQAYSFGYPNAPPLTPNKTPTAAGFPSPSPTLQTPRNNTDHFDIHSGWTPTFAEEYSVFNATPGRLLNAQRSSLDAQGQQISNQPHPLSASEETFGSNFAPQYQQSNTNPKLPLPPVEPSRRLSSSPQPPLNPPSNLPPTLPTIGVEKVTQRVTPRKTKGRLEETLSAQTATPPHTASRGIRRLAAKPTLDSMSQSQRFSQGMTATQHNQVPLLDFSATSMDMYGYPMSAPATAPVYTQGKSFWDPDSSMTGMDMDYGNGGNGVVENSSHKQSNSLDWGRSNEMFQNTANNAHYDMDGNRNIAGANTHSKNLNFDHVESHDHSYETDRTNRKENHFASPTRTGVVDPGLLFSFSATSNGYQQEPATVGSDPVKHEVVVRQPYQHQLRESRRDQQEEELRRSRPSSQAGFHSRDGRRTSYVSPTRQHPRASLQRSASESNSIKLQSHANMDRSSRSRERRLSPVKNQNRSSLTSIPEFSKCKTIDNIIPATRTDITFTIDANGRARTEMTRIIADQPPRKRSLANSGKWDEDSASESSSDEDLIIVPSRNSSFSLPEQRRSGNVPRTARFERNQSKRGRGSSVYSHSSGAGGSGDPESEAETVVELDGEERSGDATSALRKVMENRRINATRTNSRSRNAMADVTPMRTRSRSSRFATVNTNGWEGMATPSTSNAHEHDVDTPSTDRSGTTRCICGQADGDGGFMIQCESCSMWLHAQCVGIDRRHVPHVFICTFCTFTPSAARGRGRRELRAAGLGLGSSPLAGKSFR